MWSVLGSALRLRRIRCVRTRGASRGASRLLVTAVTAAAAASLLATAAAAEEIKPGDDNKAEPSYATRQTACVGDAANDQGFVDVPAEHTFKVAINCFAYYGITSGTGDGTTFSPDAAVTGAQMATFMGRAARLVGVDPDDVIGPFDTAAATVTRAEVAVLVSRLLVALTDEESDPNLEIGDFGAVTINGKLPEDFFRDSRDTQPLPVDSAVSALYELGVTKGRPDGGFAPDEPATRGDAAALITGALTHSRVRPEGVSIQQGMGDEIVISVRDSDFAPVEGVAIDAFSVSTRLLSTTAFKSDGTCGTVKVPTGGDAGSRCRISTLDPVTNFDGEVVLRVDIDERGGTTVWAWTGEEDDRVTGGGAGLARIDLTDVGTVVAEGAKVTNDIPGGAGQARFGDTVTVTVQLTGAGDKDAPRPRDGASYRVIISAAAPPGSSAPPIGYILRDDSTDTARFTSSGHSTDRPTFWSGEVDSTGKLTFTITALDPRFEEPDPDVQITYQVENGTGNTLDPPTGGVCTPGEPASSTMTRCPVFSDDASRPDKVEVKTSGTYLSASASTPNTAIITATDQYGKPLSGFRVMLTSSLGERVEIPDRPTCTAGGNGQARITYLYKSNNAATETLTARLVGEDVGDGTTPRCRNSPPSDPDVDADTATVFWLTAAKAADDGDVRLSLVDENTLIVDTGADSGPVQISYDARDYLYFGGSPVTLAIFQDRLAQWEKDIADGEADEEVVRFRLTWRYLGSASGITELKLTRAS